MAKREYDKEGHYRSERHRLEPDDRIKAMTMSALESAVESQTRASMDARGNPDYLGALRTELMTRRRSGQVGPSDLESEWAERALQRMRGRTIVGARYLDNAEAEQMGWSQRPLVLLLDDGTLVLAGRDAEMNDAGALYIKLETGYEVIPALPTRRP